MGGQKRSSVLVVPREESRVIHSPPTSLASYFGSSESRCEEVRTAYAPWPIPETYRDSQFVVPTPGSTTRRGQRNPERHRERWYLEAGGAAGLGASDGRIACHGTFVFFPVSSSCIFGIRYGRCQQLQTVRVVAAAQRCWRTAISGRPERAACDLSYLGAWLRWWAWDVTFAYRTLRRRLQPPTHQRPTWAIGPPRFVEPRRRSDAPHRKAWRAGERAESPQP